VRAVSAAAAAMIARARISPLPCRGVRTERPPPRRADGAPAPSMCAGLAAFTCGQPLCRDSPRTISVTCREPNWHFVQLHTRLAAARGSPPGEGGGTQTLPPAAASLPPWPGPTGQSREWRAAPSRAPERGSVAIELDREPRDRDRLRQPRRADRRRTAGPGTGDGARAPNVIAVYPTPGRGAGKRQTNELDAGVR
jgi:hypothetical protein